MPKKKKDYYAIVNVEVMVYFEAVPDKEDEVIEEIIESITIDSDVKHNGIEYNAHDVAEIGLHE